MSFPSFLPVHLTDVSLSLIGGGGGVAKKSTIWYDVSSPRLPVVPQLTPLSSPLPSDTKRPRGISIPLCDRKTKKLDEIFMGPQYTSYFTLCDMYTLSLRQYSSPSVWQLAV